MRGRVRVFLSCNCPLKIKQMYGEKKSVFDSGLSCIFVFFELEMGAPIWIRVAAISAAHDPF